MSRQLSGVQPWQVTVEARVSKGFRLLDKTDSILEETQREEPHAGDSGPQAAVRPQTLSRGVYLRCAIG